MQQANYRVHQIKSESEGGKKKTAAAAPKIFRRLDVSCPSFAVKGERAIRLARKSSPAQVTAMVIARMIYHINISVSGSFIFASGKKSRLKQQISRNRQHQLADDVRRGEYAGND